MDTLVVINHDQNQNVGHMAFPMPQNAVPANSTTLLRIPKKIELRLRQRLDEARRCEIPFQLERFGATFY